MELGSRSVLVAGAASALGRAVVAHFAAAGARVVALDRPHLAPALEGLPGSVVRQVADLTDEESVQQAVDVANARWDLSVAVSCVGIASSFATVDGTAPFPLDAFTEVVEVNLVGTFNLTRLAAAAMAVNEPVGEERGVVVNTASVAAFEGQAGQAAYAASASGIVGMTLPIARDLAALGIRVVTIAPGLFDGPRLSRLPEPARARLSAGVQHPARFGAPEEFAQLVGSVVANPMLNGETIRLDGALRLGTG